MPQPLSRVAKNARITEVWGGDPSEYEPALAMLATDVIVFWSRLEVYLRSIYIDMLGANPRPGAAAYSALTSTAAQRDALLAVALVVLPANEYEVFEAIISLFARSARMRNRVVHWAWGRSPEVPNAVVLIDPETLMEADLDDRHPDGNNVIPPNRTLSVLADAALVFRARDFVEMKNDIRRVGDLLAQFRGMRYWSKGVLDTSHLPSGAEVGISQKHDLLLIELLAQPEIAEFVARRHRNQKTPEAVPRQSPDAAPSG